MGELTTDDFERTTFEHAGKRRAVFRRGAGPAVIVMAELPGITPKVLRFGGWVADIGCTAVVPHLFGAPGRHPGGNTLSAGVHVSSSFLPACVSREFTVWATNRTSPVVDWLRSLAVAEHERCGGPGVGAVGMCFTGGYALAMATDDRLVAPVLSQPAMPLPVTQSQRGGIDCSPDDLAVVKHRCATDGLQVMGLRFKGDRSVPVDRSDFFVTSSATRSSPSSSRTPRPTRMRSCATLTRCSPSTSSTSRAAPRATPSTRSSTCSARSCSRSHDAHHRRDSCGNESYDSPEGVAHGRASVVAYIERS